MRRPNLFIVGAPRCGTGSLWSYLRGHPDIFMSAEKELYFFDTDLRPTEWQPPPPLEQYLRHFAEARDEKKVGEASPSYLRSQRAAKAIKAFSPSAQIIVMLRNPVDVMYSLHSEALHGLEPIADFEAALQADARRSARELIGYREFIDFPQQVQRYFDLFGRENVHTIIYDDLKENSATVCQITLRFLGVRLDFPAQFPHVNANRQARSKHLQMILVQKPRTLRMLSGALPPWLRSRIGRGLVNSNAVVRARPLMQPELRNRLQGEFKPKVEELSKLLDRDLSRWIQGSYNGENSQARG